MTELWKSWCNVKGCMNETPWEGVCQSCFERIKRGELKLCSTPACYEPAVEDDTQCKDCIGEENNGTEESE